MSNDINIAVRALDAASEVFAQISSNAQTMGQTISGIDFSGVAAGAQALDSITTSAGGATSQLTDYAPAAQAAQAATGSLAGSSGDLTSQLQAQVTALQQNVAALQTQITKLQEHAQSSHTASEASALLKEHLTALGVPADMLFQRFGQVKEGLSQMTAGMGGAEEGAATLTAGAATLGVGLVALAAAGIAEATHGFMELVDRLHELSEVSGLSIETVQALDYGMQTVGRSGEDAQRGLLLLQRSAGQLVDQIMAGQEPTGKFVEGLQHIGIAVHDFVAMNAEQQFSAIISGLQGLGSEANKTAVVTELFGARTGAAFLSLVAQGKSIEQLKASIAGVGATISEQQWTEKLQPFHKAMADLNLEWQKFEVEIGGKVVPLLTDLLGEMTKVVRGIESIGQAVATITDPVIKFLAGLKQAWDDLPEPIKVAARVAADSFSPVIAILDKARQGVQLLAGAADDAVPPLQNVSAAQQQADATMHGYYQSLSLVPPAYQAADSALSQYTGSLHQQAVALDGGTTSTESASAATLRLREQFNEYWKLLGTHGRDEAQWGQQAADAIKHVADEVTILAHELTVQSFVGVWKQIKDAIVEADSAHNQAVLSAMRGDERWKKELDLLREAIQKVADTLHNELEKPTADERRLQLQMDQNKASIDAFNASLANQGPALQHVAALERIYYQALLTGQSQKDIDEAKRQLDVALSQTGPAGLAIAAEQQHALETGRANDVIHGQLDVLRDQRGLLGDAASAQDKTALSMDQLKQMAAGAGVTVNTELNPAIHASGTAFDTLATATSSASTTVQRELHAILTVASEVAKALSGMFGGIDASVTHALQVPAGGGHAGGTSGSGAFMMPVPNWQALVTQPFGPTNEAMEPAYGGYPHFHEGIDLGVQTGTQLAAGGGGVVTQVLNQGQQHLGLSVTIDLGSGITETFGHLTQALVEQGQQVAAGQLVGLSGGDPSSPTSGASAGPHVHVQMEQNGQPIDPTSLLGQILSGPPGGTAAAASVTLGLLPPAWYAALQAEESSLPLPSPGSPQPMFGFIPGAPGSVGTGHYGSGGTAEASASLGVPAGTTAQSLFPDIASGTAALDAFIRSHPAALAGAQSGDITMFLQGLVASGYAGPGEGSDFIRNVSAVYQAGGGNPGVFAAAPGGAGSPSGASGLGPSGGLPNPALPAPSSPENLTSMAGTVEADTIKAAAAIDELQQHIDDVLTTQVPPAFQGLRDQYVQSAQAAQAAWATVADDAAALDVAMAAGASKSDLDILGSALERDTKIASATESASNKTLASYQKVAGEATKDLQAIASDTDSMTAALDSLGQHTEQVTLGQITHASALGDAYLASAQTATDAWTTVSADMTTLNNAVASGADDATLRSLRTTLDADMQKANSADKAAGSAFTAWNRWYQEIEKSTQAVEAAGEKSSAALSQLATHSAQVAIGEAQHVTGLAAAYEQAGPRAVAAWQKVHDDVLRLQTALGSGADQLTLAHLRTVLQADTGIADSAQKTADKTYQAWETSYKRMDAAQKQLDATVVSSAKSAEAALTQLDKTTLDLLVAIPPAAAKVAAAITGQVSQAYDTWQASQQRVIADERLLTTQLTDAQVLQVQAQLDADSKVAAADSDKYTKLQANLDSYTQAVQQAAQQTQKDWQDSFSIQAKLGALTAQERADGLGTWLQAELATVGQIQALENQLVLTTDADERMKLQARIGALQAWYAQEQTVIGFITQLAAAQTANAQIDAQQAEQAAGELSSAQASAAQQVKLAGEGASKAFKTATQNANELASAVSNVASGAALLEGILGQPSKEELLKTADIAKVQVQVARLQAELAHLATADQSNPDVIAQTAKLQAQVDAVQGHSKALQADLAVMTSQRDALGANVKAQDALHNANVRSMADLVTMGGDWVKYAAQLHSSAVAQVEHTIRVQQSAKATQDDAAAMQTLGSLTGSATEAITKHSKAIQQQKTDVSGIQQVLNDYIAGMQDNTKAVGDATLATEKHSNATLDQKTEVQRLLVVQGDEKTALDDITTKNVKLTDVLNTEVHPAMALQTGTVKEQQLALAGKDGLAPAYDDAKTASGEFAGALTDLVAPAVRAAQATIDGLRDAIRKLRAEAAGHSSTGGGGGGGSGSGGGLRRYAAGGWVTQTGPAIVHSGEYVETAAEASLLRGGRGGGGGFATSGGQVTNNITVAISAWDGQSVAAAVPELTRQLDLHLKRSGAKGLV